MSSSQFFLFLALFLAQCVLESISFIQRFRLHHSTRLGARNPSWNNIPEPYDEVLWENGEILWDFPEMKKNNTKNGNETDPTSGVKGLPPTDPNRPIPFIKKDGEEKPQINIKLPLYTRVSSHEIRMAYV